MAFPPIGKYTVLRLLGQGGMASVYEAVDPLINRHVAIKIIHPHLVTDGNFAVRFRQEARMVAGLRHPHIIRLYDFDIQEGQTFMVMEYLDGGSLKDKLDALSGKGQRLPLETAGQIIQTLAGALYYAHQQGTVHRDVKPANVLFTPQNEPVITDFGIAKLLHESVQISATGGIIGTPVYMSPEQAAGNLVDGQSDQYSLAVMAFEMLTGRVPFTGASAASILMQHLSEPPPSALRFNGDLNPAVVAVLSRALSKKPADRFRNILDFASALDQALPQPRGLPDNPPDPDATRQTTRLESPAQPDRDNQHTPGWQHAATIREQDVTRPTLTPVSGELKTDLRPTAQATQVETRSADKAVKPFLPKAAASKESQGKHFPRWIGFSAGVLILLAVLLFFSLGGPSLFIPTPTPRLDGYRIAIADFDGSNASLKVDFGRRIFEQMQAETSSLSGRITFLQAKQVYPDSETANSAGQKLGVDMVIWGWYDDLGVSPHIEMIKKPTADPLSLQQNQFFSVARASTSDPSGAEAQPGLDSLEVNNFYSQLRQPRLLADVTFFAANGPQQLAYISEAIIGMAFQAQGDYQTALVLFDQALANASALPANPAAGSGDSPGEDMVRFQRGMILAQLDRYPEAVQDLENAVQINPGFYDAFYNLAVMYPDICTPNRQLETALQAAQDAVRVKPGEPAAHRLLSGIYLQASQYDLALQSAQAAEKLDESDPLTYLLLREIYKAQGKPDLASSAAQKGFDLLQKSTTQADTEEKTGYQAWLDLGDAALMADNLEEAQKAYQKAAALSPDIPDVYRAQGNLDFKSGRYAEAAGKFAHWAELEPKNASALNSQALALLRAQDTAKVEDILNSAASLPGCHADTSLLLGNLYWERMDYPRAADAFSQTVVIEPDNAVGFYFLGVTLHLQEKYEQAAAALDRALELDPGLVVAQYSRGAVAYHLQDYQRALELWLAVRAVSPQDFQAAVDVGNAYDKLEEYPAAIEAYQAALSLKDDSDVRTYLALVYMKQQNYDQAVAELRQALEIKPDNILAMDNLGDAYFRSGDYASAEKIYLQALALEDNPLTHAQLALIYNRQGETQRAIEQFEKSLVPGKDMLFLHSQLASLYVRVGRLADAEKLYSYMLDQDPQRTDAYAGLGDVAYKRCDLSAMSSAYAQAAVAGSNSAYYSALPANAYAAQGFPTQQEQVLSDTLKAFPQDPIALILMAEFHLQQGSYQAAQNSLQAALLTPGMAPIFDAVIHYDLSIVQVQQGNLSAAQGETSLSLQAYPIYVPSQIIAGDLALRQGRPQDALDAYSAALAMLPEYGALVAGDAAELYKPALTARRAIALNTMGNLEEADKTSQEALVQAGDLLARFPKWPQARYVAGAIYYSQMSFTEADSEFSAAVACDASLAAQIERTKTDLDDLTGRKKKP